MTDALQDVLQSHMEIFFEQVLDRLYMRMDNILRVMDKPLTEQEKSVLRNRFKTIWDNYSSHIIYTTMHEPTLQNHIIHEMWTAVISQFEECLKELLDTRNPGLSVTLGLDFMYSQKLPKKEGH
ncbi:MAG: hypothetical protein G01um101470_931 [Parcubacteria group bacterium Gr01-1014_70]|nr:MAG: hypothetical protein G01um101470_931 [Parcubacteria group bacterium Gr01-1014_70]